MQTIASTQSTETTEARIHAEGLRHEPSLWHSITKHPWLRPYNRLAVLILALNFWTAYELYGSYGALAHWPNRTLASLIVVNFTIAIVIRQSYVINLLFAMATSIPTSFPLWLRWAAGKVYHFGGVHVGGFASGTLWLMLATAQGLTTDLATPSWMLGLMLFHCLLLCVIIAVALPKFRQANHDTFEKIGRFGSWTSLGLFWVQLSQPLISGQVAASVWLFDPLVWALGMATFSAILPWLRLKRVDVKLEKPSNHAVIASFDYGVKPFAGSSTDLSFSPPLEWHSFANIPSPDRDGFRLTISRAGDWTGDLIDRMPDKVWVRSIPTAGVGNIELLFKKVIWVATGSGIGPCLPHLLTQLVPSRLVWSTRTPRKTYGDQMVDEIMAVQPDALIWDTSERGKPDLVQLALAAFDDFDAEAVICISNKSLTFHLNYELERRGIPAFGAIWDS